MVDGMYVLVNVMLSIMSVMSPPPALCNLSVRTVMKLCTLGVFALLLGLCACVVFVVMWSSLSVSEVVFVSYVDAVVAVFVLHVCMLRECQDARVTTMLLWRKGEVWV